MARRQLVADVPVYTQYERWEREYDALPDGEDRLALADSLWTVAQAAVAANAELRGPRIAWYLWRQEAAWYEEEWYRICEVLDARERA